MVYESFENSKKKYQKIWSKIETNTDGVDRQIDIDLKIDSTQFLKKTNVITIATISSFPAFGFITIDMPDQIFSIIKPNAVFYSSLENVEINNSTETDFASLVPESVSQDIGTIQNNLVSPKFQPLFQFVNNNIYVFQYVINIAINDNPIVAQNMKADINIVILNPRIYQNIQKNV